MDLLEVPVDAGNLAGRSLAEVPFEDMPFRDFAHRVFDKSAEPNQIKDGGTTLIERLASRGIADEDVLVSTLLEGAKRAKDLRHAPVIMAENAVKWIAAIALREPDRLLWHINRLDTVAPSSAWAHVAESRGERSHFITSRELDMQRLMIVAPTPPNWNMSRGTHLETVARKLFYRLYSNVFQPFPQALKAALAVRGVPQFPWLAGNPDEVSLATPPSGKPLTVLTDFKCPTEPKRDGYEPPMEYVVQLHLYAMVCGVAGYRPGAIMLGNLYVADDVAQLWARLIEQHASISDSLIEQAIFAMKAGLPTVQFQKSRIQIDRQLAAEIQEVCSIADARVQRGEIAPWPARKPMPELTNDQLTQARELSAAYAQAVVAGKSLDDAKARLQERLKEIYAGIDTRQYASGLDLITLGKSFPLDAARAIEALQQHGVDTTALVTQKPVEPKVEYDQKAIVAELNKIGLPLDRFESEAYRMALTKAASGPKAEKLAELSAKANDIVAPIIGAASLAMAGVSQQALQDSSFAEVFDEVA